MRFPMARCSNVGRNPILPCWRAARISSALPTRTMLSWVATSASIPPTSAAMSSYSMKDMSVVLLKPLNALAVVTADQPPASTAW